MRGDTYQEPQWKPSRTARKMAEQRDDRKQQTKELDAKAAVRRRDRFCRFPQCGCRRIRLRFEVSHVTHKGMGGNPAGDRSTTEGMVYLCTHRHQHGEISRHAGTLRARFLTGEGYDGPVEWWVNLEGHIDGRGPGADSWFLLATESGVQQLETLTPAQQSVCDYLAKMEV